MEIIFEDTLAMEEFLNRKKTLQMGAIYAVAWLDTCSDTNCCFCLPLRRCCSVNEEIAALALLVLVLLDGFFHSVQSIAFERALWQVLVKDLIKPKGNS